MEQPDRPVSNRTTSSSHTSRGRFIELELDDHSPTHSHVNVAGAPRPRPRTAHGNAPLLPPIPRVASQYGGSLSQLERTILNLHVEESTVNPDSSTVLDRRPMTAGGVIGATNSRSSEFALAPFSPFGGTSPSTEAVRPRTASSNFSRPMQASLFSSTDSLTNASPPHVSSPSGFMSPTMSAPSPKQPQSQREEVDTVSAAIPSPKQMSMPPPPRPRPDVSSTPFRSTMPPPSRAPPPPPPPSSAPAPAPIGGPNAQALLPTNMGDAAPAQGARSFSRPFMSQYKFRDRPLPPPPSSHTHLQQEVNVGPQLSSRPYSDTPSISTPATINLGSSAKPKQPMFNRFNPMSLLSRRKGTQPQQPPPPEIFSPPLPDDFDPSIRGHLVHDFSAPRAKPVMRGVNHSPRNSREQKTGRGSSTYQALSPSQNGRQREIPRTPVFTEHFDDDNDGWRLDDKDRRNQNSTGIASRVPADLPQQTVSSLPVFAKRVSQEALSLISGAPAPQRPLSSTTDQNAASDSHSRDYFSDHVVNANVEQAPRSTSTPEPAGSPRSDGRSSHASPRSTDGVPVRLKSNSSRFSFDLAGVGSAVQEKLLEDKHRQRAAQKARESTVSAISVVETEDGYGYDEMDMDGGFEEDFPGMDDDDDDFPRGNVSDFTLPPAPGTISTHPLGGLNKSWNLSVPQEPPTDDDAFQQENGLDHQEHHALENTAISSDQNAMAEKSDLESANKLKEIELQISRGNFVNDDDLYFDDGMMDSADLAAGEAFDESLLDDEESKIYGIPLRDQPKTQQPYHIQSDSSQQSSRPISLESAAINANQAQVTTDTSRTSVQPSELAPLRKSSLVERMQSANFDSSAGLTQDNLAAYHDALAFAANKAAMEGRFNRKASFGDTNTSHQPRVSFNVQDTTGNIHTFDDDDDDGANFGFDDMDDMDDDAIIAEANAEALENDEDGFYGQEFGFYAQSNGEEGQRVNGGYFGTGFEEMVKRSHSGRAGGQDPSLTPITERSEWSQRNSMISLAMQGSIYGGSIVSPGLAQLAAAEATHDEENMSLSALMRLRRGAFGDSTTSLHSSAGSHKSGSPSNAVLSPGSQGVIPLNGGLPPQTLRSGSPNNFPLRSPELGPGVMPLTSPLLHAHSQNMIPQRMVMSPTFVQGESSAANTSVLRPPPPVKSHSRNSSGAESVTYVKEQDGSWVMERRRTSEMGEVEVLGRQVLESGRI